MAAIMIGAEHKTKKLLW